MASHAFEKWIARKDLLERGQKILNNLANMDELHDGSQLLKDITDAVVAIECAIIQASKNSLMMKPFFFKWLKQNCTFSNAVVDDKVYQKLSNDIQTMIVDVSI